MTGRHKETFCKYRQNIAMVVQVPGLTEGQQLVILEVVEGGTVARADDFRAEIAESQRVAGGRGVAVECRAQIAESQRARAAGGRGVAAECRAQTAALQALRLQRSAHVLLEKSLVRPCTEVFGVGA